MRANHLLVLCCLALIACSTPSTPSTPDASTSVDAGAEDAGAVDAGPQACVNDTTCAKTTPRCDTSTGNCVVCLLSDDNCAAGFRCVETNGVPECAMGCKGDAECQQQLGAHGSCCIGVCVDTSSNSAHCSGCGLACGDGATCCNSDCTDLSADPLNCNMCGSACSVANAEPVCEASQCGIDSCKSGFDDCNNNPADGCEIDKLGDAQNCGSCGYVCSFANGAAACTDGQCELWACVKGFADCNLTSGDGCEINVSNDVMNCGFCGGQCITANGMPTCVDGQCAVASCNPGFDNCNNNPSDGCETNLKVTASDCGSCGFVCGSGQTCVNGFCVL